jgi:hypothetical protein
MLYNYFIMDVQFRKRKTGKDKERRTRELYGNHSAKHVRIQEQCQENHLKNIQEARLSKSSKTTQSNNVTHKKETNQKNKKGRK